MGFRAFVCLAASLAAVLLLPPSAAADGALSDALENGTFIFNGRLRYEHVDQANFAQGASGLTFRARFGFETASFKGFKILVEGDFTRALGVDDFNSTVNGKLLFPVIADPNSARLNRATLSYAGWRKATFTTGRQRIILDDARFVGNVGFRQNEQTFDAARMTAKPLAGVTLNYIYLWRVNRIFGSRSAAGATGADTHLVHLSYDRLPLGTITGYAYLVDLDALPALSSQTYGARLSGKQPLGGLTALYAAGYARQTGYGNSPSPFGLDFVELEGGLGFKGAFARLGWQKLEGNGARGFQTPLATLHAFQGFADVFLTTPPGGIEDLYLVLGYRTDNVNVFGAVEATVWLHDFSPDVAGPDLGEEIDFEIAVTPAIRKKKVRFSFKLAAYSGSPAIPDVTKFWLTGEWAF